LLDRAGVDALLIGDSLGMVIGGHASTLPVTLDEMIYHTRCVAAGTRQALAQLVRRFHQFHPSSPLAPAPPAGAA